MPLIFFEQREYNLGLFGMVYGRSWSGEEKKSSHMRF
jgi:hypothetical protein